MIWKHKIDLDAINASGKQSLTGHLGIEFTDWGDDYLSAKMPVDKRTVQPYGLLHGGASVVLAESIGSVASLFCIENMDKQVPVGVDINANHLSSARSGYVIGTARPYKIGRKLHVWNIEITDEKGKLICVSRLTVAIIENTA